MEYRRANKNYSGYNLEPSGPVQQWVVLHWGTQPSCTHPLQEPWLLSPILEGCSSQQRHQGNQDVQPQVLSRWKLLDFSVIGQSTLPDTPALGMNGELVAGPGHSFFLKSKAKEEKPPHREPGTARKWELDTHTCKISTESIDSNCQGSNLPFISYLGQEI